jgi:DNA-binding beta-propeller fold protein YncE
VLQVGQRPHEVALSAEGHTAYVSNFGLLEANHHIGVPGTNVAVIDVQGRRVSGELELPKGLTGPHGLKLRPPRYQELFTNTEIGVETMVVFDVRTHKVKRQFALPEGVHNFVFKADGSALYAFTLKGQVCRIDPDSGAVIANATLGSPRGLAWSRNEQFLISSGKNELVYLNPNDLSVIRRVGDLGVGQIFYPSLTPDGKRILAPALIDSLVLVVDVDTGEVLARVKTGSPLMQSFLADGKVAVTSNVMVPAGLFSPDSTARDGGLVLIDLNTYQTTVIPGITDLNGLAIYQPHTRQ